MSISEERAVTILGVKGRYFGHTIGGHRYHEGTFTRQRWSASRGGSRATIRFDDECRNGYNTFAITHENADDSGGYGAGEHFPELKPLEKWHLCSTDGPMHYLANVVYFAGDRDHYGKREGEAHRWSDTIRFGTSPIQHRIPTALREFLTTHHVGDLEVLEIHHDRERDTLGPKYTFGGYKDKWHECPFDTEDEALQWAEALQGPQVISRIATAWSKGKERELDAARRRAIWPEATDAELCVEREELEKALTKRLPALLADFRQCVESLGFSWAPAS